MNPELDDISPVLGSEIDDSDPAPASEPPSVLAIDPNDASPPESELDPPPILEPELEDSELDEPPSSPKEPTSVPESETEVLPDGVELELDKEDSSFMLVDTPSVLVNDDPSPLSFSTLILLPSSMELMPSVEWLPVLLVLPVPS